MIRSGFGSRHPPVDGRPAIRLGVDDQVEILGVEAVRVIERAVEQADRAAHHDDGEVPEGQHGRGAGIEGCPHRLQPRLAVGEQHHLRLHFHRLEAALVVIAAQRYVDRGPHARLMRRRCGRWVDDLRQDLLGVACLVQRLDLLRSQAGNIQHRDEPRGHGGFEFLVILEFPGGNEFGDFLL